MDPRNSNRYRQSTSTTVFVTGLRWLLFTSTADVSFLEQNTTLTPQKKCRKTKWTNHPRAGSTFLQKIQMNFFVVIFFVWKEYQTSPEQSMMWFAATACALKREFEHHEPQHQVWAGSHLCWPTATPSRLDYSRNYSSQFLNQGVFLSFVVLSFDTIQYYCTTDTGS